KGHPRIALRGKLDSLEARIIEAQVTAEQEGFPIAALDLQELLLLARRILGAEVKETPLGKFELLGMDSDRLRYVSHHVTEELGINHPVPHYSMGKLCAVLNSLRTAVRETELAAVAAFSGEEIHGDLIEALNRMSSCVYIIFCRKLSGFYSCEKRENEHG
ncbi:MAG: cobalamin adenosyltransferase, partial [Angelakisella sp.]